MTTPLPGKEDIDVTGVPISQDFVKWVLAAKASSGKFCVFTQFSYNLLFMGTLLTELFVLGEFIIILELFSFSI